MKKLNNKGFTLLEMLIVVAIIAVLAAIAIPTMTTALEKSRESADASNIRSCYAEVMTAALTEDVTTAVDNGAYTVNYVKDVDKDVDGYVGIVTLTQKQEGWQNKSITNIAGEKIEDSDLEKVASGKVVVISYSNKTGGVTFSVADETATTT